MRWLLIFVAFVIVTTAIIIWRHHGHHIYATHHTKVVHTANGPVVGYSFPHGGKNISFFGGLPFAEPPVGALRFHYPQPYSSKWHDIYYAVNHSNRCPQIDNASLDANVIGTEDCLYLDVYSPSAAVGGSKLLPVMLWLYGGGFLIGWNGNYNASSLVARHRVVLVLPNYRMNILGFNTFTKGKHGETGTQGVADQRLAMIWTQDNIKAFGGDPSQVTIFGESSGAISVMYHLVSSPSWPYFSKAIMESGTSKVSWFFQPKKDATEFHRGWARGIGCNPDDLKCLQRKNVAEFVKPVISSWGEPAALFRNPLYPYFTVGPVIDGTKYGLRDIPIALVESGHAARVPLLLGGNNNEGTIFEFMVKSYLWDGHNDVKNEDDLEFIVKRLFGEKDAPKILDVYRSSEFAVRLPLATRRYHRAISRMVRDAVFLCSNRALAKQWAAQGLDAFMYVFDFDLGPEIDLAGLGDYHTAEIPFVFRSAHSNKLIRRSSKSVQRMSNIMSCQWASFAYSGNPNGGNVSAPNCHNVHRRFEPWPKFDNSYRLFYSLQLKPRVLDIQPSNVYPYDEFPSDARCDLWDAAEMPWRQDVAGSAKGNKSNAATITTPWLAIAKSEVVLV